MFSPLFRIVFQEPGEGHGPVGTEWAQMSASPELPDHGLSPASLPAPLRHNASPGLTQSKCIQTKRRPRKRPPRPAPRPTPTQGMRVRTGQGLEAVRPYPLCSVPSKHSSPCLTTVHDSPPSPGTTWDGAESLPLGSPPQRKELVP